MTSAIPKRPDYIIGQIPGGGQRGYASALLLEYFENHTGLPTHKLFPHITAGSVGILLAAGLYLPHPDHPKSAMMTAKQLVDVFPEIASRLPKGPAYFRNRNNRQPLIDALTPYIGTTTLRDMLGTVFFSAHEIGGLSKSHKTYAKIISPQTGQESYIGSPDTSVMDIALSGTAIPSIFRSHNDQIDLAFADVPASAMIKLSHLYPQSAQGAFVRIGNFRGNDTSSTKHLESGGFVLQTFRSSVADAISDNSYAQTIATAQALFGKDFVFNLEQEIEEGAKDAPAVSAIAVSPAQFAKVQDSTRAYIESNQDSLIQLADTLGEIATRKNTPAADTAFSRGELLHHPIPLIEPQAKKPALAPAQEFLSTSGRLTLAFTQASAHVIADIAQSVWKRAKPHWNKACDDAFNVLFPRVPRHLPEIKSGDEKRPPPDTKTFDHI